MRPFRVLSILSLILALALPAAAQKARDLSFVYLRDTDRAVMSGDIADLKRVRKAVKPGERILWFRTADGKELVVRDPATLDRFEAAWKTADALATKLGEIGGKQGEIGGKQGQLGGRQGELAAMEVDLALEDDDAQTAAQRQARAKKRRAIETEMRQIEQKLRELEVQLRKLEPPMRELERQSRIVSKQHDAAAKQAHADTEALIARAIAAGLARPL
ncbi:MAG TPA: hypothetical protein VIU61_18955 [Kofleriaceae bacterium]